MTSEAQLSAHSVQLGAAQRGAGSDTCDKCPRGRTTAVLGSANEADCVSPELNFIAGFVTLALVIPLTLEYMVHGRFHRVAFLRRTRVVNALVNDSTKIVKDLYQFISLAGS